MLVPGVERRFINQIRPFLNKRVVAVEALRHIIVNTSYGSHFLFFDELNDLLVHLNVKLQMKMIKNASHPVIAPGQNLFPVKKCPAIEGLATS
jgi:hypothetical protein